MVASDGQYINGLVRKPSSENCLRSYAESLALEDMTTAMERIGFKSPAFSQLSTLRQATLAATLASRRYLLGTIAIVHSTSRLVMLQATISPRSDRIVIPVLLL